MFQLKLKLREQNKTDENTTGERKKQKIHDYFKTV